MIRIVRNELEAKWNKGYPRLFSRHNPGNGQSIGVRTGWFPALVGKTAVTGIFLRPSGGAYRAFRRRPPPAATTRYVAPATRMIVGPAGRSFG